MKLVNLEKHEWQALKMEPSDAKPIFYLYVINDYPKTGVLYTYRSSGNTYIADVGITDPRITAVARIEM